MNIILAGPPLTGKTTLGKQVACKFGWPFIDTDMLVEKCYKNEKNIEVSCREIFKREGETQFRAYEQEAVLSLQGYTHSVISLGGGALEKLDNVRILKKIGKIIYIKTSLALLEKRLLDHSLPSYLENEEKPLEAFQKLVRRRSPFYELYADQIIETGSLSASQIVAIIYESYHGQ
ncbi:shikimate kinase [Neochlamydia sp. S13]|uniref:shikimate kinase n=1 Tax=Neochlamydia sp. S13 TaxID=1353976 RepID=UPI0005AA5DB4|nr:shikimate kinase [Neochlamydia sp. S13]BBI17155.1 Shikimate kinase [Neochlamydia sp. S13]